MVEKARAQGKHAEFLAMCLPNGVRHDKVDAQTALNCICADRMITIDIEPPTDAMLAAFDIQLHTISEIWIQP